MELTGTLILIVAPSGSGKGALIAHVRERFPDLVYPMANTTRAMRPGEEGGQGGFHFLSHEEFEEKATRQEFLEWVEYGGNLYGTPKEEIIDALSQGKCVLREVEIQGARKIREAVPKENLAIVFIDAGEWGELERRIVSRAHMTPEELEKRRLRYEEERHFAPEANYLVLNRSGKLEEAKKDIERIITSIIESGT